MSKERPQLAPSSIYLDEIPNFLKEQPGYEIKITYNGLFYYRRLGILPPPERIPGTKYKFYNIDLIVDTMYLVRFMHGTFELPLDKIGVILREMGVEPAKNLILSMGQSKNI